MADRVDAALKRILDRYNGDVDAAILYAEKAITVVPSHDLMVLWKDVLRRLQEL